MVRTKADSSARKAVAAKAPRKALGNVAPASGGGAGGSMMSPKVSKYAGGNSVCDRPTPDWQKGINSFFNDAPQSSKPSDKENENPQETEQQENVNEDMEVDSSCGAGSSSSGGSGNNTGAASSQASEQSESSEGTKSPEKSESSEGTKSPEKSESPTPSPVSSPVKKTKAVRNGIIDSDSDED